jgi:hypothetical protein
MFLVEYLQPQLIVELGTHTGNSFNSFCQAVKQFGIESTCYAVDSWVGDDQAGLYGDEVYKSLKAYHDYHYPNISSLIRKYFDEAIKDFRDESIELLHIDGCHTYEAVKHDFNTWLPKVRDSGVILLHDTQVRRRDFGVYKFFEEIIANTDYWFEFSHSNGLGIWVKGTPSQSIADLLFTLRTFHAPAQLFRYLGEKIQFSHSRTYDHIAMERFLQDPNRFGQVYVDQGNGFNETDSTRLPLVGSEVALDFDLQRFEKILLIRLDPINDVAQLCIDSLKLLDKNGSSISVQLRSNATFIKGNQYNFDTEDPQIEVHFPEGQKPYRLLTKITFNSVGQDAYRVIHRILGIQQKLALYKLEVQGSSHDVRALLERLQEHVNELHTGYRKLKLANEDVTKKLYNHKLEYSKSFDFINESMRNRESAMNSIHL